MKECLKPCKGNFKGKSYNSSLPPPPLLIFKILTLVYSINEEFVVRTLYERLENGSLTLIG